MASRLGAVLFTEVWVADWGSKLDQTISVDLDYYDTEQQELLDRYPTSKEIRGLIKSGMQIPIPEFLAHFLYHRLRVSPTLYPGIEALRRSMADAYGMLGDLVDLSDGSLFLPELATSLPSYLTEYIGESVALSAMNRIHGVTEADWKPIRVQHGVRSLDYELASDERNLIRVEAKGTYSKNTEAKSDGVYSQKYRVVAQKEGTPDPTERVLSYGAITVIPTRAQPLKCWLLDPVPDDYDRSPRDFRIISRMRFMLWIVRLVSPRSRLAIALASRVVALEALRDPYELSGIPLIQSDEGPVEFLYRAPISLVSEERAPFFASRSYVLDGPAGGVITPIQGRRSFFFTGFREELLDLSESQNFDVINKYSARVASLRKTVRCRMSTREFGRLGIPNIQLPNFERGSGYVRFELEGTLHYSQEGLVFGELPLPSNSRPVRSEQNLLK